MGKWVAALAVAPKFEEGKHTRMERQQIIALFLVILMIGSMLAYAALLV